MNDRKKPKESDRAPLVWPDVPRIVFGPGAERRGHVARLDWVLRRPDPLTAYAEGYREAAAALFKHMASDYADHGVPLDPLLFPLAFLWRHHVELALKDIIARGKLLNGDEPEFPTHHRLQDLWREAKPYIDETGDPAAPEVANVAHNIAEIERLDAASFSFRYPTAKDGTSSLPSSLTHVDVPQLHEAMSAVANFFDGVISMLDEFQHSMGEDE